MLKNELFLLKYCRNHRVLGLPPRPPWLRWLGALPQEHHWPTVASGLAPHDEFLATWCLFHFSKLMAEEIKLWNGLWSLSWFKRNSSTSSSCSHQSIIIKQKFRPKNALFLLKNPKNCQVLGALPPNPLPPAAGGFVPKKPICLLW